MKNRTNVGPEIGGDERPAGGVSAGAVVVAGGGVADFGTVDGADSGWAGSNQDTGGTVLTFAVADGGGAFAKAALMSPGSGDTGWLGTGFDGNAA